MKLSILFLTLLTFSVLAQSDQEIASEDHLTKILDSLPIEESSFLEKTSSFLRISSNKDALTLSMKEQGLFCSSCKSLFSTLQKYQLTPIRFVISEVMEMMCTYYWKQDPYVCKDAVKTNGKIVLDSLQRRYLDGDLVCPMLNLCPSIYENIDITKLIEEIIKEKPQNIKPIVPKREKVAKILHMTDLHFDQQYADDSNAFCDQPTCCRKNSGIPHNDTSKAGYWGSVANCDLPFRTLEATANFIKRNFTAGEIDFIIWTGDSTNHFIWDQTQEENINNTLKITELFQRELPNIPVFPVMGNHESYPCNVYDYESEREKNLNSVLAEAWKNWIGKEAAQQYKEFGFYSTNLTKLGNKLRIIAINTQAGNPFNWFLLKNPTDPGNQLAWMRQELQKAELNSEMVYIIGHIPSDETIDNWADIYTALVERYSHIIRGQFYGHTHQDHFKVYMDRNSTRINNIAYITSSVTTYGFLHPSFRLFELDQETFQILNFNQYRMNTNYYNGNNIKDMNLVNYDVAYNFNSLYQFESLSNYLTWENHIEKIRTDLPTYQNYRHHLNAGTEDKNQFTEIDSNVYCELNSSPRLIATCQNKLYKRNFLEMLIGDWMTIIS